MSLALCATPLWGGEPAETSATVAPFARRHSQGKKAAVHIAKADDLAIGGDLTSQSRLELFKAAERFADDDELALDRGAKHEVASIVRARAAHAEIMNELGRVAPVQKSSRVMRHTAPAGHRTVIIARAVSTSPRTCSVTQASA